MACTVAEREGFEPPGPEAGRFQGGCNRPLCHRSVAHDSARGTLRAPRERCQSGRMGRPAKALIVSSDPWVQIPPSPLRRTPANLLECVAVDRNFPPRIASANYMHVAWVTIVLRTCDERTRQYFSRIVERARAVPASVPSLRSCDPNDSR